MDFTLSADHEVLKALVERFVSDRRMFTAGGADPDSRSDQAARSWALLAQTGLPGLPFDEALGGSGGGEEEIATVMEALGRGVAGETFLDRIVVAGRLIEAAGTEAQRSCWIPGIVDGTIHLALAHAEHATRFDLAGCRTRLVDGHLTGSKTCVPGGAAAYIVTAIGPNGPGLFLASADAPGLEHHAYTLVDASPVTELQLSGVPAEELPGGFTSLETIVQSARVAACAEMLGLMDMMLDTTLDHVRQRSQFGVPIGSFQAIQHRLANIYVSADLSRSHLYRCMLAPASQRVSAVAAAKSYISTAAIHLGEECIQFHGGMGVSDEMAIGHAHKRVLVLANFFGNADYELARYNRAASCSAITG